jgi:hypothetical protein
MLRARHKPHILRAPLRTDQHRTRLQAAVVDTKAVAVDTQAVVVDMKVADATKLLLHRQQFARQTAELTSSAVLLWPKHLRLHRVQKARLSARYFAASGTECSANRAEHSIRLEG